MYIAISYICILYTLHITQFLQVASPIKFHFRNFLYMYIYSYPTVGFMHTLLAYHSTPTVVGYTPSELLMNRKLRTTLVKLEA